MYSVPYGKGELHFALPSGFRATVVRSRSLPVLSVACPGGGMQTAYMTSADVMSSDPRQAIRTALANPISSAPLAQLAGPGDRVCIVFTDITRASPDHLLVPPMLEALLAAGVRREDITLLCGIGMHRPSTLEEKVAKLGAGVVERFRVVDHEPQNPAALVDLGTTPSGIPLTVNRIAYEADLLIATGIVEPHQYAGYSGGRKTLAVGAAGEKMIEYTHGPAMLEHPGTRLGNIAGNRFHEAISEAAYRAGLRFIINAVLDDNKRIVAVRAGAPEETFLELVGIARSLYEVPILHQFDIAVAGVGFPKDSNLYQASRAPSYLFFAPVPVVRPGGYYIVPARCEEGAGEGAGEQRFLETMRRAPNPQAILDDARRNGYKPGEQRCFVMAKVLEQCPVIIVGSECPDVVRACKMIPAATMDEAFAIAGRALGPQPDVLIVPHALLTLPIVQHPSGWPH